MISLIVITHIRDHSRQLRNALRPSRLASFLQFACKAAVTALLAPLPRKMANNQSLESLCYVSGHPPFDLPWESSIKSDLKRDLRSQARRCTRRIIFELIANALARVPPGQSGVIAISIDHQQATSRNAALARYTRELCLRYRSRSNADSRHSSTNETRSVCVLFVQPIYAPLRSRISSCWCSISLVRCRLRGSLVFNRTFRRIDSRADNPVSNATSARHWITKVFQHLQKLDEFVANCTTITTTTGYIGIRSTCISLEDPL